jgi:hypothetical protein
MKGDIKSDHIPVSKYKLLVAGFPSLTIVELSGLEDEIVTTELPDRTVVSGGQHTASEFTIMMPDHHLEEQAIMETWFIESTDPVSPSYKKIATLIAESVSGNTIRSRSLIGVFPKKRKLWDGEMANEGEIALVEWTLSVDEILPI